VREEERAEEREKEEKRDHEESINGNPDHRHEKRDQVQLLPAIPPTDIRHRKEECHCKGKEYYIPKSVADIVYVCVCLRVCAVKKSVTIRGKSTIYQNL